MTKIIRDKLKNDQNWPKYILRKRNFENYLDNLNIILNEYTKLILDSNKKLVWEIIEKRNSYLTAPKTYLKILCCFLLNIKTPSIPPLVINGKIVSIFFKKAVLFHKFFASKFCTLVKNSSIQPLFQLRTDNVIDKVFFSKNDITQIIKKINPNKPRGWDNIRMTKVCDKPLSYPMKLIFWSLVSERSFSRPLEKSQYSSISCKRKQQATEKL